jgi:hypothetical protein
MNTATPKFQIVGDKATAEPMAITAELVQERFTDALRVHVGKGKAWTAEALAEVTGIDERTIRVYLEGGGCPTLAKQLRLASVLPPSFTDALIQLAGLGHVKRLAPAEVSAAEIGADRAAPRGWRDRPSRARRRAAGAPSAARAAR